MPLSDIRPFLFGSRTHSSDIEIALRRAEEAVRAPPEGCVLGLAVLRFGVNVQQPIFVMEMPEFTNVAEDVGEYNPDWEERLRATLAS